MFKKIPQNNMKWCKKPHAWQNFIMNNKLYYCNDVYVLLGYPPLWLGNLLLSPG